MDNIYQHLLDHTDLKISVIFPKCWIEEIKVKNAKKMKKCDLVSSIMPWSINKCFFNYSKFIKNCKFLKILTFLFYNYNSDLNFYFKYSNSILKNC